MVSVPILYPFTFVELTHDNVSLKLVNGVLKLLKEEKGELTKGCAEERSNRRIEQEGVLYLFL